MAERCADSAVTELMGSSRVIRGSRLLISSHLILSQFFLFHHSGSFLLLLHFAISIDQSGTCVVLAFQFARQSSSTQHQRLHALQPPTLGLSSLSLFLFLG